MRRFSISFFAVSALVAGLQRLPTLSLLVWEGYADPSFIHAFEACASLQSRRVLHGLERRARRQTPRRQRFQLRRHLAFQRRRRFHRPRRTRRSARSLQNPVLHAAFRKTSRFVSRSSSNGQIYGVPFMWGPNPLLYDTTAFPKPPDSWTILWDPKYRGKDFSLGRAFQHLHGRAGSRLRQTRSQPALQSLRRATRSSKEKTDRAEAQRPQISGRPAANSPIFSRITKLSLAMGWPLMTAQLRKLNFPIGETIPKENTTGWIDHLMITAASTQQRTRRSNFSPTWSSQNSETRQRRHPLHSRQSRRGRLPDRRRNENPPSRRSRRLHAAHLFLAGRSAPRQVQRDLERGKAAQ